MNENGLTLPSFAKINWNLRVLGRRDDGFHELCTVFQTVSLHDDLTFSEADELILTCDDEKIPTGETNLVVRAARVLQEKFSVQKGARIQLEKRIPAPGGLGGGSSNAAIALLGLRKLWRLEISIEELHEIGAKLGADVPLFLYGGTTLGTGRGTEIVELEDVREENLLIVAPPVDVPTGAAFARLNAPRLTNFDSKSILKICRNEAERLILGQTELKNDFERSVFALEPEIEKVREQLLERGARQAVLSGSGASVFAVFDKQETRQATMKALNEEKNWRMFAVATISRDAYRAALAKVF